MRNLQQEMADLHRQVEEYHKEQQIQVDAAVRAALQESWGRAEVASREEAEARRLLAAMQTQNQQLETSLATYRQMNANLESDKESLKTQLESTIDVQLIHVTSHLIRLMTFS